MPGHAFHTSSDLSQWDGYTCDMRHFVHLPDTYLTLQAKTFALLDPWVTRVSSHDDFPYIFSPQGAGDNPVVRDAPDIFFWGGRLARLVFLVCLTLLVFPLTFAQHRWLVRTPHMSIHVYIHLRKVESDNTCCWEIWFMGCFSTTASVSQIWPPPKKTIHQIVFGCVFIHLPKTPTTSLGLHSGKLKMDGWNTSFLWGWPIFRGELLVSGSVIYTHVNCLDPGAIRLVPPTSTDPTIGWYDRTTGHLPVGNIWQHQTLAHSLSTNHKYQTTDYLGGGFKFVHPYLRNWSNLTDIFSNGLKPPTSWL